MNMFAGTLNAESMRITSHSDMSQIRVMIAIVEVTAASAILSTLLVDKGFSVTLPAKVKLSILLLGLYK